MPVATKDNFGHRMRTARVEAKLSLTKAAYKAWDVLPEPFRYSYGLIARLETGEIDEVDADPVFLAGLARAYRVPLADLSELAVERLEQVIDLREPPSRCTTALPEAA